MKVWVGTKPKPGTLRPRLREALIDKLGRSTPQEGPVILRLRFIFKDASTARPATPTGDAYPSVAALTRAVLDELPGLVYLAEAQVVALHAAKEYGNVDGFELSW